MGAALAENQMEQMAAQVVVQVELVAEIMTPVLVILQLHHQYRVMMELRVQALQDVAAVEVVQRQKEMVEQAEEMEVEEHQLIMITEQDQM